MSRKFYTFEGPRPAGPRLWTYQVLTQGTACHCFRVGTRAQALADARRLVKRLNSDYGPEGKRYRNFSTGKSYAV